MGQHNIAIGQHYMFINFDKGEYVDPGEFWVSSQVMLPRQVSMTAPQSPYRSAMASLLESDWRGDRVALVGDLAYDAALEGEPISGGDWLFEQIARGPAADPYLHAREGGFKSVSDRWLYEPDDRAIEVARSLGVDLDPGASPAAAVNRLAALYGRAFRDKDAPIATHEIAAAFKRHGIHDASLDGEMKLFDMDQSPKRYVVNETKGVAFDLARSPVEGWISPGNPICRLDPLVLVMACGNGIFIDDYRGCGDRDPSTSLVGCWLGDTVFCSDDLPDGIETPTIPFSRSEDPLTMTDEEIWDAVGGPAGKDWPRDRWGHLDLEALKQVQALREPSGSMAANLESLAHGNRDSAVAREAAIGKTSVVEERYPDR